MRLVLPINVEVTPSEGGATPPMNEVLAVLTDVLKNDPSLDGENGWSVTGVRLQSGSVGG